MQDTVLLIDHENVSKIDLSVIPAGVRVPFFFGASQKTVPIKFMQDAQKLGDRFIPINIGGHGKNALDFHIAFYLGEHLAKEPHVNCVILSKDKGFDPLIKHLLEREFRVKRVNEVGQAFPPPATGDATQSTQQPVDALQASLSWLSRMEKPKRPRKRKGLVAHLYTHFAKKIPEQEMQRVVERMIADKALSLNGESLTYHF